MQPRKNDGSNNNSLALLQRINKVVVRHDFIIPAIIKVDDDGIVRLFQYYY